MRGASTVGTYVALKRAHCLVKNPLLLPAPTIGLASFFSGSWDAEAGTAGSDSITVFSLNSSGSRAGVYKLLVWFLQPANSSDTNNFINCWGGWCSANSDSMAWWSRAFLGIFRPSGSCWTWHSSKIRERVLKTCAGGWVYRRFCHNEWML